MIGHLYRYPHPFDPTKFIYVGQGPKRDSRHRSGKSPFGRRFKKKFPGVVLSQPIREQIEVENQLQLNEEETIWMFRFHTWRGYPDGMNSTFPGSQDYKAIGLISGQKNVESGHMSRVGKKYGPINGRNVFENGQLARICSSGGKVGGPRTFEIHGNPGTREGSIKGGIAAGKKNVESGHMSSLGKIYGGRHAYVLEEFRTSENQSRRGKLAGQINVESGHIQSLGRKNSAPGGPLAKARHERWHIKRNIVSDVCDFCKS